MPEHADEAHEIYDAINDIIDNRPVPAILSALCSTVGAVLGTTSDDEEELRGAVQIVLKQVVETATQTMKERDDVAEGSVLGGL